MLAAEQEGAGLGSCAHRALEGVARVAPRMRVCDNPPVTERDRSVTLDESADAISAREKKCGHRVQQSMRRAAVLLTLLSALPPPPHVHAARTRTGRAQATAERADGEPTPSHQVLMEQEQHQSDSPSTELQTALVSLEEAVDGEHDRAEQMQPISEPPEQAPVRTRAPRLLLCSRPPRRPLASRRGGGRNGAHRGSAASCRRRSAVVGRLSTACVRPRPAWRSGRSRVPHPRARLSLQTPAKP